MDFRDGRKAVPRKATSGCGRGRGPRAGVRRCARVFSAAPVRLEQGRCLFVEEVDTSASGASPARAAARPRSVNSPLYTLAPLPFPLSPPHSTPSPFHPLAAGGTITVQLFTQVGAEQKRMQVAALIPSRFSWLSNSSQGRELQC